MPQEQEPPLPLVHSLNSGILVRAVFFNSSDRVVLPVWVNFKGEPVPYRVVPPRGSMHMNTYLGHPWLFRDAKTDEPMKVNNKSLFLPQPGESGNPSIATITLPAFQVHIREQHVASHFISQIQPLSSSSFFTAAQTLHTEGSCTSGDPSTGQTGGLQEARSRSLSARGTGGQAQHNERPEAHEPMCGTAFSRHDAGQRRAMRDKRGQIMV